MLDCEAEITNVLELESEVWENDAEMEIIERESNIAILVEKESFVTTIIDKTSLIETVLDLESKVVRN